MTNIDIDNDVEIATEETVEEREQEIAARYTAQCEIVESEDEEEPEEPDPVPVLQNADMKKMPDQLRIDLETKSFCQWKTSILSLDKLLYKFRWINTVLFLLPRSHCYLG